MRRFEPATLLTMHQHGYQLATKKAMGLIQRGLLVAATAILASAATVALGADSTTAWLSARKSSDAQLLELISTGADQEAVIRARITLADRGLNRSIEAAELHLIAAEAMIAPDTAAASFALAIRCQLEHRQGMPSAAQACSPLLADEAADTEQPLVTAFHHVTLAYYHYRGGQHDKSVAAGYSALSIAQSLGDHDLIATANNIIGLHFSTRLRPRMSIVHFETALEHARLMVSGEFKILIQLNLASSYTYLGRAEEALELLREAQLHSFVELYPTRQLVVQSMIAHAKSVTGDTQGVEQALLDTINIVQDKVLPDGMTYGWTGLGLVQLAEDRPFDALANFDRVLSTINKSFETDMDHPRVQLIAVPYAAALRESGRTDEARGLLESVVAAIPEDEPDQILVNALKELAATLQATGNTRAARAIAEEAIRADTLLWDDNFRYRIERLNVTLELDRRQIELELAQARASALEDKANREATLKRLSSLAGALGVIVAILLLSRRLQKRVADTERAANERLEELVEQRTQQLSDEMAQRILIESEQRRLSEKLSEGEKMRALGQLTAGVAHDFNNLMSVVMLTAENLKFSVANGDRAMSDEMIRDILSATDAGAKITEGLLAYARKQPLRPETLQLDVFLREALPIFRNTLGARIELTSDLEPCHVMVDKSQLTTSLLNLVLNSKDAMPDGGRLAIVLRTEHGKALIEVCDSGAGMSEETRQRAFEPFMTTKPVGDGTGLGMSLAYGFARQSGGDLSIESALNQGTTVTLSLPLAAASPAAQQTHTGLVDSSERTISVLVVEDRDFLLLMLERTLKQLGMHVRSAANADEAIENVDKHGLPDLLVSDISMPGALDGPALAKLLRERDTDLPVLLISGYAETVDSSYGFLRKPFSVAQLEHAIAEVLGQQAMP